MLRLWCSIIETSQQATNDEGCCCQQPRATHHQQPGSPSLCRGKSTLALPCMPSLCRIGNKNRLTGSVTQSTPSIAVPKIRCLAHLGRSWREFSPSVNHHVVGVTNADPKNRDYSSHAVRTSASTMVHSRRVRSTVLYVLGTTPFPYSLASSMHLSVCVRLACWTKFRVLAR